MKKIIAKSILTALVIGFFVFLYLLEPAVFYIFLVELFILVLIMWCLYTLKKENFKNE
tara:strand:+ start:5600 stop:5773 length:174 start_codon:yes stop_codon:yes gene_type:complete